MRCPALFFSFFLSPSPTISLRGFPLSEVSPLSETLAVSVFFFSRAFLLRSEICDNNERTSAREMQGSHSTRTHSWLDSADGFDMVDRN